jgi:hypothetical protein
MPPECAGIKIRLAVEREETGETWVRYFGEHPFITRQEEGGRGLLVERHGSIELRFRLMAAGGTLEYRQAGARIRLGSLRVPLPVWLAPRIRANEASGDGGRVTTEVVVALPIFGEWLRYSGWIALEEQES